MDEFFKKILEFGGTGGLSAASALNPATAIMGAIPGVYQLGKGIIQDIQGDKLAKSAVRPVMNMTPAQQAALAQAFNLMRGEAPGSQAARDAMARSQAGSIAAIQNSGGGGAERLAALTRLNQNANTAAMDLGAMQQQFALQQAMNYQNQLMQADETQKRQFLYNQDEPYRNTMAKAEALDTAGPRNIMEGLERLGRAGASAISQDVKVNTPDPNPGNIESITSRTVDTISPSTGIDERMQRTSVQANDGTLQERVQSSVMPSMDGINQRSMRTTVNIDEPLPEPKGPFPIGYDPETRTVNPVAGPPNYNPSPAEPTGPFPVGYNKQPGMSRVNPALLGPAYRNVMKIVFGEQPESRQSSNESLDKAIDSMAEPFGRMYGKSLGGDKEYIKPSVPATNMDLLNPRTPTAQDQGPLPEGLTIEEMKQPRQFWFGKDPDSGKEVMYWRAYDGGRVMKANTSRKEINIKGRLGKWTEITPPYASK